ncbi:MAG: sulfatase-like hydrolase/transferase [Acidobacteria bacterium]|nr:sulfatase-like hydrolase/transferase [Acidobacteriota bacterium]
MNRHTFRNCCATSPNAAGLLVLLAVTSACAVSEPAEESALPTRPNIVYLYADDLGYAEVGAYGQEIIRTPNIDRLAAEGMRFTAHYSGSAVCAPSRATLLTGKHSGHAYIRDNKELGGWGPDEPEGQWPLAAEEVTLAELLKAEGYATAAIGKWGLGGPDDHGHPNAQGFDLFYGYLCQRVAHNYYPTHLWRNRDKDMLPGNEWFSAHQRVDAPPANAEGWGEYASETYAPDRMVDEALKFIRDSADSPFFLYFPTVVPHVAIQVPEDSLADYAGTLDDAPYLGERGCLPHPEPRAGYAAMVTRMDRDIGEILDLLDELGLAENTVVMFSSDNGPTFNGGTDSTFFGSAAGMRGLKTELYEGGIKAPMIARWPGRIPANATSDHLSAQWDVLPTVLDLVDAPGVASDGLSFAPTLLASGRQELHEAMYWELGRQQAVRANGWKLYRRADRDGAIITTELFHLDEDPNERTDLASDLPERVEALIALADATRTPSELFPSPFDPR